MEDIKALIEKINQEGVAAAEEKAGQIEKQAGEKAEVILKEAKAAAEKMLSEAQARIAQMQEKQKSLISQAARDMLLALRQEINALLNRLVVKEIDSALAPEELCKILEAVIRGTCAHAGGKIVISLNKDDLRAVEDGLLTRLKKQIKTEIVLKAGDDLRAGFVISYDEGKSQFDFSDKALAEYIGTYLKPKLKDILG